MYSGGRKQHVCHPIALMARICSCNASHTNTQGPADSHTVLALPGPSFTQVDLGRLSVSPFSLRHGKTNLLYVAATLSWKGDKNSKWAPTGKPPEGIRN